MRISVARIGANPGLAEFERAIQVGAKRRSQGGGKRRPFDVRSRLTEIIVRSDGSLLKQGLDPDRRGSKSMGRRSVGSAAIASPNTARASA